jgi:hypothetical protein
MTCSVEARRRRPIAASKGEWDLIDQETAFKVAPSAGATLDPKALCYALWTAAAVAALWGFYVPYPYPAAVLANVIAPLLGLPLLFWSKGQVTVAAVEAWDPQIAPPFLGCGLVLLMRAMDCPVQLTGTVLLCVAVASVALTILAWRRAADYTKGISAVFMFAMTLLYSASAVVSLDRVLDLSPPKLEYLKISEKHASGARSKAYTLSVTPPQVDQAVSLHVDQDTYGRVSIGDIMLVGVHRGALGMRWFDLRGLYRALPR